MSSVVECDAHCWSHAFCREAEANVLTDLDASAAAIVQLSAAGLGEIPIMHVAMSDAINM
jgi:hypothetical protein